MNSYFAACEQQANPHLRGRPMGVCEHLGGIIIAPSVEAKRRGIKTGTPVWEARKLCPEIILLRVDPAKVRTVTERLYKIFSEYSYLVERYSIDEAFLDLTHLLHSTPRDPFDITQGHLERKSKGEGEKGLVWDNAILLALEIKHRIWKEVGEWFTCSIGIAPNKLLAKIASDMDKPDGLKVIRPSDIPNLYSTLALTDIPGIANRMAARLAELKIYTLRDLSQYPESLLHFKFGIVGVWLKSLGNLQSIGSIVTPEEEVIKSMGHSYTMPRATSDERVMKKLLFKLSEKVAVRLRRRNMWGSVVSMYARFPPNSSPLQGGVRGGVGKGKKSFGNGVSHKIGELTNDGRIIFKHAWKLFLLSKQTNYGSSPLVRMMGVTVSSLVENLRDEPLFAQYLKPQWALSAMDKINEKHGDFTLRRAAILDARTLAGDTVGFGRMKEMKI